MALSGLRKYRWVNIVFIAITGVVGFFVAPFYVAEHGLRLFDILLFSFMAAATGLSITMGYHRCFAHSAYRAHPVIRFLYLFFGAAAFEQSALKWAAQHRDHHAYTDTARDPYNINKGFWFAHVGWLFQPALRTSYENAQDLSKDPVLNHQHRFYGLWAIGAGILFPVFLGYLAGRAEAALLIGVCFRIAFVHHATFCINSVCHMMGTATYDPQSTARDHWFVALFTFGEGYHNFHHRFPSDYRNGIRWYHWDPSKWLVSLMAKVGLASDLKQVSQARILQARVQAEKYTAACHLTKNLETHPELAGFRHELENRYAKLQQALLSLEAAARDYPQELQRSFKAAALARVRERQEVFQSLYRQWNRFIQSLHTAQLKCRV